MKILFVASEGLPYSKTGGLADVVDALPRALLSWGMKWPCCCRAIAAIRSFPP